MKFPARAAAVLLLAGLAACASKPRPATPGNLAEIPPAAGAHEGSPRGVPPSGPRPGSQDDLAAAAGDRVFFAFDSYALSDEARSVLDRQAAWLADHPAFRVTLAGNADERGTREYNLALGARRAAAARQHLIARGVAADRLATVSWGKERPLDPRPNEAGWAMNRNAQTLLPEAVAQAW